MPLGHTGLWPRPRRKPRERIIACFDGETLTDEYGQSWAIHDYNELCHVAFSGGYDVYVRSLVDPLHFPYLLDAIADEHAAVLASQSGRALGLRLRDGREWRYVGSSQTWSDDAPAPGVFTRLLRRLFDTVGVGTYATPGALGEALWATLRSERMSVPNEACAHDLRSHAFGGRADTPGAGRKLAQAYEIDLRSAYVALAARVPTGTAERIVEETNHEQYASGAYYARCTVELPARRLAAYSPVPYRAPSRRGQSPTLQYPTAGPLTFDAWLWREEVQRARRLGIRIAVNEGWWWNWWDTGNRPWIERISSLRREAGHPVLEDWLKRASVAAIGRHAQAPLSYELVFADDPRLTDNDIPVADTTPGAPPITGLWLHLERDDNPPPRLPHMWSYVTMRCRLALYDRMELERKAGNTILMTNFDSILLEQATSLPTGEGIGEWKQQTLHDVHIKGPRSLISREKTRLPGIKRETRHEN